jgi:UDP-glucose:glycoprotein glucosyltransferase
VPIESLPNKWLWCEAWCNGEGEGRHLSDAKIVDFCTDPRKSDETKFEKAKRIVAEYENDFNEVKGIVTN